MVLGSIRESLPLCLPCQWFPDSRECREQKKGLFITFVDLTKVIDTLGRKGLWKILWKLDCPPKFLTMVIQLKEDQLGRMRHSNILSRPFKITNGKKQD